MNEAEIAANADCFMVNASQFMENGGQFMKNGGQFMENGGRKHGRRLSVPPFLVLDGLTPSRLFRWHEPGSVQRGQAGRPRADTSRGVSASRVSGNIGVWGAAHPEMGDRHL